MIHDTFRMPMNNEVVKELMDLEGQIREEKDKPEIDKKKIAELRARKIMRGMAINTAFIRTNNNQPY